MGSKYHDFKFGNDKTPEAVFQQLVDFLSDRDTEGIVWHHPDGRMCKIKKRDLGLPRLPGESHG